MHPKSETGLSAPRPSVPMKLWMVTPVKPFGQGKSRLAAQLTAAERAALNRHLLGHVLAAGAAAGVLAGRLVVSREAEALAVAQAHGAETLDEGRPDLNGALEEATTRVMALGGDAMLILPSDLPRVTADEIRQLARLGETRPMVISPSRDGGTNALFLRPPDALQPAFGPESFARHSGLADDAGVAWAVLRSPGLAFDVDWPDDLADLLAFWRATNAIDATDTLLYRLLWDAQARHP